MPYQEGKEGIELASNIPGREFMILLFSIGFSIVSKCADPGRRHAVFPRDFKVLRGPTSIPSKRIGYLRSISKCARGMPKPWFYQGVLIVFAESILQVAVLNDTPSWAASYTMILFAYTMILSAYT